MRNALQTRLTAAALAVALAAGTAGCGDPDGKEAAEAPPAARIELDEHRVPASDPGAELYLREKRATSAADVEPGKVVLFLEPFGVPTAEAFDVAGMSWMDDLAEAGYDTWALDFQGFGQSSRPAAMDQPPMANPPLTTTADAVRDVDTAIRYITDERGVDAVSLIGWSFGGVVAGAYAAEHPDQVDKLVLYGAMHGFPLPMMTQPLEASPGVPKPLPAYQLAPFDLTLNHWNMMMAGRELATPEAIEAVRDVFLASDPTSSERQPPSIRRAMGPMVDLYAIWSDKPVFDASRITAPVLVIAGDADSFADPTLLRSLTGSPDRREVIIPDATHWALYERNRDVLLRETEAFLRGS